MSEEKHKQAVENEYNFDCPDAFDTDCIVYTLRRLKEGKSVEIPVYNFTTHKTEKKKVSERVPRFYCFCIVRFTVLLSAVTNLGLIVPTIFTFK